MSFLTYRKIREVRRILEEWFLTSVKLVFQQSGTQEGKVRSKSV